MTRQSNTNRAARTRLPEYKPLLFTTTVRNPERVKFYLYFLQPYVGQILTDNLSTTICRDIIKTGLYRPMCHPQSVVAKWPHDSQGDFAQQMLTDEEADWIIKHNPQQHKEAGFNYGWPSRFATFYMLAREFGFAYVVPGEPIEISDVGRLLLSSFHVEIAEDKIFVDIVHPEYETRAFMHAMVKYHRDNPFLRVLNTNVPLILLLQVIKLINADPRNNNCGVSRKELPLLIFWKDSNAQAVYDMIMDIRSRYRYEPSDEVIEEYCRDKIMGGAFKAFKLKSLVDEYPDEYIRKMRLTGLVTLRGGGRFIDINHFEDAKIDYIINTYSTYHSFSTPREYYEYVSSQDNTLLEITAQPVTANRSEELLARWVNVYSWEVIKREMSNLSSRSPSHDDILKYLPAPVRLEFLTAIAIKLRRPTYRVKPNYPCDDEGLPTSTAGGDQGDIECFGRPKNCLVEVTMAEGRSQTVTEIWPIARHLTQFIAIDNVTGGECVFIAPSIFKDSQMQINYVRTTEHLVISAYTINDFISVMDKDSNSITVSS